MDATREILINEGETRRIGNKRVSMNIGLTLTQESNIGKEDRVKSDDNSMSMPF